ncbi:MAG: NUDIX hydrolase [Gemmatimonadetes bacterium]|nr:NUDIX hydrolase [Gemmatimonadota bacterium]
MSEQEPKRLARRPVHDGRIVHLSIDTVRLPDGSVRDLEFIQHAGASAILPVVGSPDAADPEVLLIRQYRYASGGYLYEVPAGMPMQQGEPWEDVARRELEEETGWRAGRLIPLTRIFTTPGFTDEVIHLFLATDLVPGTSKLDEDEFLEVVRVPLSLALEWVREGRIVDGKSVVSLLFVARFSLAGPPAGR